MADDPATVLPQTKTALETLELYGLLLESDPKLPSVAALVAGEPIKGSWWAHALGHTIFGVNRELAAHPDVLVCKLVSGKVTWVHRRLWPAVVAVGSAREPWQLDGLGREARALLNRVTQQSRFETSGDAARELETMLLVFSEQVHTEKGSHAKILETWAAWARRVRLTDKFPAPEQGRKELEQALAALNRRFGGKGRLPWPGSGARVRAW